MAEEKQEGLENQRALLVQMRTSLRRYAFVFTALGTVFTAVNVLHQMYIRSIERATLISRDPVLIEKQLYLAKSSAGGKDYKISSKNQDDFRISLIVLMNYYESTAEMVDRWMLFGPVVRSHLQCPLGKHARLFVLGESRPGYWSTDGAFFSRDQFPATMRMYDLIKDSAKECEPLWR